MLKLINPIINADLLWALRAMGHGDRLVVVDVNFPAHSVAQQTVTGRLLRANGTSPEVIDAILSLMPLDSFVDDAAQRMEVEGNPQEYPQVQAEAQAAIDRNEGKSWPMVAVDRYEFYDKAKQTFAVVQTNERRFWGCFILAKGVIPPEN